MRILIKASAEGFPETESGYCAYQGFSALGFRPVLYKNISELAGCRQDDLVIGGVSVVRDRLASYGITVQEYDYPEELSEFLGRHIWTDTLSSVLLKPGSRPVFVKPVRDKMFTGTVLHSEKDAFQIRGVSPDEPVLCSEPVIFRREWRAFVRYGKIFDVRPYRGDWDVCYDPSVLDNAVKAFRSAPAGYAADFGVTEDGRTLLVEINDGFALGCYGADPVQYAKLLSARWCELIGIPDKCDIFFEKTDWIREKQYQAKEEKICRQFRK